MIQFLFVGVFVTLLFPFMSLCQTKPLNVGDLMPDIPLMFTDAEGDKARSLHEFRGNYVLLDFWSTSCRSCIESFPKLEMLQAKYSPRLQILLINPWEDAETVGRRMQAMQNSDLPTLPSIKGDTVWKQLFTILTIPHLVWINPEGRIFAITNGYNANDYTISRILKGEEVNMIPKYSRGFDLKNQRLQNHLHSERFDHLKSSVIWPFYEGGGAYGSKTTDVVDHLEQTIRNTYLNVDILTLFRTLSGSEYAKTLPAGTGVLSENRVLVELADPQILYRPENDGLYEDWCRKMKVCYESIFPLGTPDADRYAHMFDELNNFSRMHYGINFSLRHMEKTCFVLQRRPDEKIGLTDSFAEMADNYNQEKKHYNFSSCSFDLILRVIGNMFNEMDTSQTFLSDFSCNENVDMEIPKIDSIEELSKLNNVLSGYGLEIVKDDRVVKCLVISLARD